jgi:putative ABC transport system permease protein
MRTLWIRVRSVLRLLAGWTVSAHEDEDAREEMLFHVDMQADKLRRAGVPGPEARRRAELAFGGVTTWAELARDEYRWRPLDELVADVRYATRSLLRVPSFTIAVVLSLAIGIGATSAAYTVIDRVVLRPLPYSESGRIVSLWTNYHDRPTQQGGSSFPDYIDWVSDNPDIEAATAFNVWNPLLGGDTPRPIGGVSVTADYFKVLGTHPILGRTFSAEEAASPAPRVVIVSYEFWQRELRGDPRALGTTISLTGIVYTVIGVLPPGLRDPQRWLEQPSDVWRPLALAPGARQRGTHFLRVLARLRPAVSVEQAQQHLSGIARRLSVEYPRSNGTRGVYALPLQDQIVGPSRTLLFAALGASLCVLLIACANVATLVHARQVVRAGELALRKAIGAEAARLVRLLITESILLGAAGAVGGIGIALTATGMLRRFAPADLPRAEEIVPDARVLAVVLLVTLGTVILFGLRPALAGARTDPGLLLQDASARHTRRGRARSIVVSLEIAMALVLLALTGLLTRTLIRVNRQPLGLDAEHVATFRIAAPVGPFEGAGSYNAFIGRLSAELRSEPGVLAVSTSSEGLLGAGNTTLITGSPSQPHDPGLDVRVNAVSAGYFGATGIRLIAGRDFVDADSARGARVAILNRSAAALFYPGENPVGRQLLHYLGDKDPSTIVAVADDARLDGPMAAARPEVFEPQGQANWGGAAFFVVRTARDPATVLPAIRRAVKELVPSAAVTDAHPLTDVAARFSVRQRFYSVVFGAFAAIGLVLASIGIYGLVAYAVVQRRREIAIRTALGASAGRVLARFAREGVVTLSVGLGLGILGTVASSRVVRSLLFDVSPTDPLAIGAGAVVLCVIGLAATLMPALSATTTPVVDVLRSD